MEDGATYHGRISRKVGRVGNERISTLLNKLSLDACAVFCWLLAVAATALERN